MFIFWSFAHQIVAIHRFPTVKSLLYLLTDITLKDFCLLYAKAIAKAVSFVFLFQYVDSVLFYTDTVCNEYLFFDLSRHSKQF
jgi:hypothetical protein